MQLYDTSRIVIRDRRSRSRMPSAVDDSTAFLTLRSRPPLPRIKPIRCISVGMCSLLRVSCKTSVCVCERVMCRCNTLLVIYTPLMRLDQRVHVYLYFGYEKICQSSIYAHVRPRDAHPPSFCSPVVLPLLSRCSLVVTADVFLFRYGGEWLTYALLLIRAVAQMDTLLPSSLQQYEDPICKILKLGLGLVGVTASVNPQPALAAASDDSKPKTS